MNIIKSFAFSPVHGLIYSIAVSLSELPKKSQHHVTLLNLHLSEAWDQEEIKMAPGKWRALQTPKHPKHYSGCTHVITLDRFLEEWKCADLATGTSRTSLN